MGWRLLGTAAAGAAGILLHACGAAEFTCQSDAQCMGEGSGVCQADGHCSFPDADCASGQRYAEHSGPQSGQCVGEAADTGSTGGASTLATMTDGGPTTAPMDADSGPTLDSGGLTTTEGPATTDATTGPVVSTTGVETSSGEVDTGEPVDPDLVLWLALDRAPLGDVLDSSSYMGNGTCEDPACPAGGRGFLGAGAAFDGEDDVIQVPHAAWLETTDGYTIAAFIRIGGVPLDFRSVMAKPFGPMYENSWEIYFQAELLHTGMSGSGVDEYWEVTTPWTFAPDAWVHLASTWDGGLLTLWLDGEAAGSIEVPAIVFDDQAIHVGADDDHHAVDPIVGHFLGSIDDVRVYRRALAADEIAALAAGV